MTKNNAVDETKKAVQKNTGVVKFSTARKIIAKGLKEPGLRQAYKANIAMCIYDNRNKGRLNLKECNEVADKLIELIWG